MKDQDKKSAKADKKEPKEKDAPKSPDKKLAKAVAKQVDKDLEKRLEKAVKQIRKETKKALEQALDRINQDTKRALREALAGSSPDATDHRRSFHENDSDFDNQGVQEVTLDIEPDELHLADEIPVVTVNDTDEDQDAPGEDEEKAGRNKKKKGKKTKEVPATDQSPKGGQTPRPQNPRKKGTAEAEIGSRTGAPASPMDDAGWEKTE